jgi:glutathione synthase/RimK-type ligase-like ATP-grasp enzyme
MKKIGVLFGWENSFPSALMEQINARHAAGIAAEFLQTGAVLASQALRYAVIVDRISHDIPFYRAFLKHAALSGTAVINDPFWCSADDKFFNYALAARLGVAVPPTVLLPQKEYAPGTTEKSLRNLEFPLDWDAVFVAAGEHGFLKPMNGAGGRDVREVRGRGEFFRAYDQSRNQCMVYQKAIEFSEYYRCFVVGRKKVRIMAFDPRKPHVERYLKTAARATSFKARKLFARMEEDALKLCRALGYDLNSVEFAVEKGVPYAIDFMNPVPDADINSVGQQHFEWMVRQTAELAIARARGAAHASRLHRPVLAEEATAPAKRAAKRRVKAKDERTALEVWLEPVG